MSSGGRKRLVWDIRKSLLALSAEELLQVEWWTQPELAEGDPEGCYHHINAFMHSKQLMETGDEGMVQLLMLKDTMKYRVVMMMMVPSHYDTCKVN